MENGSVPVMGIIGAMEQEIALIRESMHIERQEEIAGMCFLRGSLEGRPAVVVRCGLGKVNAAICAQTLILRFGAAWVINTGVGGALRETLSVGDIVVSTDAVQHDLLVDDLGFPRGQIPYTDLRFFEADEQLRRKAVLAAARCADNVRVYEGRICSGDQFVADKEKKQELCSAFDGLCCEMEGAAIAQVCALSQVPFVIVRAISDGADESGRMSFETFVGQAARRSAAIVCQLARMA